MLRPGGHHILCGALKKGTGELVNGSVSACDRLCGRLYLTIRICFAALSIFAFTAPSLVSSDLPAVGGYRVALGWLDFDPQVLSMRSWRIVTRSRQEWPIRRYGSLICRGSLGQDNRAFGYRAPCSYCSALQRALSLLHPTAELVERASDLSSVVSVFVAPELEFGGRVVATSADKGSEQLSLHVGQVDAVAVSEAAASGVHEVTDPPAQPGAFIL